MIIENIILIGIGSFLTIIILSMLYFLYLEEKRKCQHKWEETERIKGWSIFDILVTEVHLKCVKCGDVKKKRL